MTLVDDKEIREKLLNNVKKEVKQLMELSVTCKFIHEDNYCLTNLCTAIESCLLHGLKKDFLNRASTFDLLKKISKDCKAAKKIVNLFDDLESNINLSQKNQEKDGLGNLFAKMFTSNNRIIDPETINHYIPLYLSNSKNTQTLWVKISILNKTLTEIIDYILKNASKFYYAYALMANSVDASVLLSLIAGPCSFDKYTRFKTIENAEPDADELIRRHKLHSIKNSFNNSKLHNLSNFHSSLSPINSPGNPRKISSNNFTNGNNPNNNLNGIKEFIESLHQNLKSQLIFGKNHVMVNQKEKPLTGYLSLHQHSHGLILNWTPNEILNGSYGDEEEIQKLKSIIKTKGCTNWNDAFIHLEMNTIAYLHCHQQQNTNSMVIFVSQDGTQYPPILFTDSSSLVQFLISLENGLNPYYKLEPEDWKILLGSSKMPVILKKSQIIKHDLDLSRNLESSQIFNDLVLREHESPNTIHYTKPNFNDFVDNFHLSPINSDSNSSSISSSTPGHSTKANERIVLKNVCNDMKYKIMSRAFYGWLNYHKRTKAVNKHLIKLINFNYQIKQPKEANKQLRLEDKNLTDYIQNGKMLDRSLWDILRKSKDFDANLFYELIYSNGIESNELRRKVWPFIMGLFDFKMEDSDIELKNKEFSENYHKIIAEWKPYQELVRIRDEKRLNTSSNNSNTPNDSGICSDLTTTSISGSSSNPSITPRKVNNSNEKKKRFFFNSSKSKQMQTPILSNENNTSSSELNSTKLSSLFGFNLTSSNESFKQEDLMNKKFSFKSKSRTELLSLRNDSGIGIEMDAGNNKINFFEKLNAKKFLSKIISKNLEDLNNQVSTSQNPDTPKSRKSFFSNTSNLSIDEINRELAELLVTNAIIKAKYELDNCHDEDLDERKSFQEIKTNEMLSPLIKEKSKTEFNIVSPISVNEENTLEVNNKEVFDLFALNIHRIDKDVLRCDRNYWYFSSGENLNKLRNVIYTYTWETLDIGYIQGMCDLIAPLLVIFDDEPIVYECFKKIMEKMSKNFVSSAEMDTKFMNMRSLVQVLDQDLFDHMNKRGDHTQFYFTYRWFLLDFKRELIYNDIFTVWETIWASRHFLESESFPLFIALALIETYREIILENEMDFTDIIKFFNEMSEKHDIKETLNLARNLVDRLRSIIAEKYAD